ncbi:MAG: tyrosine-type recombinase/integrase [Bacillota bacterium]
MKKNQNLQELISELEVYIKSLSYHRVTQLKYQRGWSLLNDFMVKNSIKFYNPQVGEKFIFNIMKNRPYKNLSRKEKDLIRIASITSEFQATGVIKFRSVSKKYNFDGEIGKIILIYLKHLKFKGYAAKTLESKKIYLLRLLDYLKANNILSLNMLENQHILQFINGLGIYSKSTIHNMFSTLKGFFKYLYQNGTISIDFSYVIPKSSYKKESKLPTTYTKDEVKKLLKSVDRANPKGKRDYAMILLAARLGLRASDICRLKFKNIKWEQNNITIKQTKTARTVELPLLTEVGNAIIDYLKYGRPESELPYIFICIGQPYDKLKEPTLHSIVSFYLKRAKIANLDKKKHGPHVLRHSLASCLLEQKTPLPIISEVLGHSNTGSTKTYLRIDLNSLKQCSLEVPVLNSPYYTPEVN